VTCIVDKDVAEGILLTLST